MRNLLNKLLLLIWTIMLVAIGSHTYAQSVAPLGNAKQQRHNYGSYRNDGAQQLPRSMNVYPWWDSTGNICFDSLDTKHIWYHDGTRWVEIVPKDYVDSLFESGGGGGDVVSVNGQTGIVELYTTDISAGDSQHLYWNYGDTAKILSYTKELANYVNLYGLKFPNTVPRSIAVDTLLIPTKYYLNHISDSVAATAQVNLTDTANAHLALINGKYPAGNPANYIPSVNIAAGSGISVAGNAAGTSYTVTATGGGGSGSVTSVNVVTANGVSGTVLNPTTTPAITLALGAITPGSVVASGAVTGSNLSGTNTGDQTITLTNDVTGSGTGSFAATLVTVNATPGTYGDSKHVAQTTVDSKGRSTGVSNVAIDYNWSNLISIPATTLTGDITSTVTPGSSGTATLKNTGTAGTYGDAAHIPVITTDPQGRVSSVGTATFSAAPSGSASGDLTGTYPGPTIASSAVTNSKIANATIDLTAKVTGSLPLANGGTATTVATSINATPLTYGANNTISIGVNSVTGTANQITVTGTTTVNVAIATNAALPGAPTTTTPSTSDNTTKVATTAFTQAAITATSVNAVPLTAGANNTVTVPVSTGITGLGTGVATFLATPSSSNFAAAITDETGTGAVVLAASPALTGSPTAPTQTAADNSTKVASTAYVDGTYQIQYNTATSYTTSTTPTTNVTSRSATVEWFITAQSGALLFNAPTGTWADGQLLEIRAFPTGSVAALTYNSVYTSGTIIPASTTTASQDTYILFQYNSRSSKFNCIGSLISN